MPLSKSAGEIRARANAAARLGAGRRALRRTLDAAERPRGQAPARRSRRQLILSRRPSACSAAYGYDGVSLDTIAGAARVTKPILYRHFELQGGALPGAARPAPARTCRASSPSCPADAAAASSSSTRILDRLVRLRGRERLQLADAVPRQRRHARRSTSRGLRMYEDARAVLAGFLAAHPAFDIAARGHAMRRAEAIRGAPLLARPLRPGAPGRRAREPRPKRARA